jgi:hypothetical protein
MVKKEYNLCPTCQRPFNSKQEALNNLLNRAYPAVMVEVEEPKPVEKKVVAKKPVVEETEEDDDLRLED